MGPKRFAFATATCAFFVGCYVAGDSWPEEAARTVKDAAPSNDALWPTFDAGEGFDGSGGFFVSTQPKFGSTTSAADAPPPISGGTLLVTRDGTRAIASDPDRDLVYIVDLGTSKVRTQVVLPKGDEPGRLVEDGAGRVHVALRGGGALLTIDGATGAVIARRAACPSPRGVDWDSSSDNVILACATGELVSFPASGGDAVARWVVERDLRDVNVSNGAIAVTSFRKAQVLRLSGATIARRDQLPSPLSSSSPHVVWRSVLAPSGALVAVHQSETMVAVVPHQGGYGDGAEGCGFDEGPPPPSNAPILGDASTSASTCPDDVDAGCLATSNPIVRGVLTVMRPDGTVAINRSIPASVPVDVAVSRDGKKFAVAASGNALTQNLGTVLTFGAACANLETPRSVGTTSIAPTAVAFDAQDDVIVQTREPAALWILDAKGGPATTITLSTVSRADTGVDIFHTQAGALMACASCHPEGGDDGHVWMLDGKARRTPSLRGTIAGTAPYHWPGDEKSLDALVFDVYTQRMSGAPLQTAQLAALENWVQTIPAPRAPSWLDASSVQRGAALFASVNTGCTVCHTGPKLTNNQTLDVGTGGAFQVPPLVGVGWRTPLLHDGCASTIADRFGKCSTPAHGSTSTLTPANIADLSNYLESL